MRFLDLFCARSGSRKRKQSHHRKDNRGTYELSKDLEFDNDHKNFARHAANSDTGKDDAYSCAERAQRGIHGRQQTQSQDPSAANGTKPGSDTKDADPTSISDDPYTGSSSRSINSYTSSSSWTTDPYTSSLSRATDLNTSSSSLSIGSYTSSSSWSTESYTSSSSRQSSPETPCEDQQQGAGLSRSYYYLARRWEGAGLSRSTYYNGRRENPYAKGREGAGLSRSTAYNGRRPHPGQPVLFGELPSRSETTRKQGVGLSRSTYYNGRRANPGQPELFGELPSRTHYAHRQETHGRAYTQVAHDAFPGRRHEGGYAFDMGGYGGGYQPTGSWNG